MASRLAALIVPLVLLPTSAASAAASWDLEQTSEFNISPAPLTTALLQFSAQAHVQIASSGAEIGSVRSPGVVGRLPLRIALATLLSGTGFEYRVSGERSIAVVPQKTSGTAAKRKWPTLATLLGVLGLSLSSAPTPAQQAAESDQLQEVVVTAEKTTENLQKAPAAITSVSGDTLTVTGLQSVSDMSVLFPAVRFEQAGFATHLYVRGIGAEQDRITVDQLVNLSLDGVLLPREMDALPQIDARDVELLPGPQGTLYGASSVGGVVSIQGNRPTAGSYNKLTMEAGNFAQFHVQDVQNVAISDSIKLRAAVDYLRHSPYDNTLPYSTFSGAEGAWTADTITARAGLSYTPTETFSAYVWALVHNDNSLSPDTGTLDSAGRWITGDTNDPWNTSGSCITKSCNGYADRPNDGPARSIAHDYIIAADLDWKFDAFTITDSPSLLRNQWLQSFYAFVFPANYDANNHQLSNELRVSNNSPAPFKWLAGLYWYRNTADQLYDISSFWVPHLTVENAAPYAQLTYSITDQLRVTAGARYSWTRKSASFIEPNALPQTAARWSTADWKAGIEYDLAPATMAYLTAQTGSSPGTLDAQDPVAGRPSITKLTRLYSLTAGWKSRLFSDRLQLNDELFYYDYRDFLIQTVICGNPVSCFPEKNVFLNAPKLVSWGNQLDLRWLVTAADQLTVGAAFNRAQTGHWVTNAGADLSHQTLMEAPETTVTLGLQHVFNTSNGGTTLLRIDSNVVSGYFGDFQTQPGTSVHESALHQRAYSITGASLTYHAPNDRWTLGLWSRNLENKAQIGPGSALGFGPVAAGAPFASAPRTYGIRFTSNFETSSSQ